MIARSRRKSAEFKLAIMQRIFTRLYNWYSYKTWSWVTAIHDLHIWRLWNTVRTIDIYKISQYESFRDNAMSVFCSQLRQLMGDNGIFSNKLDLIQLHWYLLDTKRVYTLGRRALKTPTSETPDSRDPAHASSTPLAQTLGFDWEDLGLVSLSRKLAHFWQSN